MMGQMMFYVPHKHSLVCSSQQHSERGTIIHRIITNEDTEDYRDKVNTQTLTVELNIIFMKKFPYYFKINTEKRKQ